MTNIKDLLKNDNETKINSYESLNASHLGDWTVDYKLIELSQFMVYRVQKDEYIDLLQLGKPDSNRAKQIVILNYQNSDIFNQLSELNVIDGKDIRDEITALTKDKQLEVRKDSSNNSKLTMNIFEKKSEDKEQLNESHN